MSLVFPFIQKKKKKKKKKKRTSRTSFDLYVLMTSVLQKTGFYGFSPKIDRFFKFLPKIL